MEENVSYCHCRASERADLGSSTTNRSQTMDRVLLMTGNALVKFRKMLQVARLRLNGFLGYLILRSAVKFGAARRSHRRIVGRLTAPGSACATVDRPSRFKHW